MENGIDTTATAPAPGTPTETVSQPVPATTTDPFSMDEATLAALSPEGRTAVEPILQTWKKSAMETLTKERTSSGELSEKAKALDTLVKDPKFVKWYQDQMNPQPQRAPVDNTPKEPLIRPEDWADALQKMAGGDSSKWEQLNEKLIKSKVEPSYATLDKQTKDLNLKIELNDLFTKHPDAKDLDTAGVLEPFLYYYTDLRGRPMEEAYQAANKSWNAAMAKAKNAALGMVNGKKESITETAPTSSGAEQVIEVNSPDEMLRRQIEATMKGQKVRFQLRRKG